jgi:hypothetical protein
MKLGKTLGVGIAALGALVLVAGPAGGSNKVVTAPQTLDSAITISTAPPVRHATPMSPAQWRVKLSPVSVP